MITYADILMDRDGEYPLNPVMETNVTNLLEAVNKLEDRLGLKFSVSSGYRPGHYNKAAGGAPNSAHLTCEAVDLHDRDGKIKKAVTVELLVECGLWQEDPTRTPTWCHLQTRPAKNRVFRP